MCSATLEAFGAVRSLSALTEHAKSEEEGRRTSEPLDSLIGGVLANQCDVWEGRNTVCTLVFYALRSVIPRCHALQYWHETSCYVHSGQMNCVCLVMPRCMFSMQLFLSEIVKFHFDQM